MEDMPRPRKPYIQKEVTRHGKIVWYFRRGKEPRVRLPGAFGSKDFNEAYAAAFAGLEPKPRVFAPQPSLRWLVDRYYESPRFNALRPNTQRNYRLELERVCKTGGSLNFAKIDTDDIRAGMMRRENRPHMVAEYVKAMRALFRFAKDSKWIGANPTEDITSVHVKTAGYHTWTVEEVERYQAKHPVGTQARLALDIMLYTGLRRGDAITLGRQHVRGGTISIRAGKNGAEIVLPILPPLAASIEATKTGDMVFLVNTRGRPWKNISFGYWFAARCEEAKVPGRAHGLRKAGATIAANNGATPFELTAMYGWSSTKVAEIYTQKADKVRLAERAANKLYPHPAKGAGNAPPKPLKIKASRQRH
jgi:integrase